MGILFFLELLNNYRKENREFPASAGRIEALAEPAILSLFLRWRLLPAYAVSTTETGIEFQECLDFNGWASYIARSGTDRVPRRIRVAGAGYSVGFFLCGPVDRFLECFQCLIRISRDGSFFKGPVWAPWL